MKHQESTEMDRLLRRYSRLKGETLRASRGANDDATEAASGAHLDADEMNAYAEGALPENARSRYFAHLADCDSCRKLVTDLTLAASREDEGKARVASLDIKPPTSWREWLSTIFSPPVLRYGVPALALFAVIIVAIVATRTQRQESSVAQNKDEAGYSARVSTDSTAATQNTTATGPAGSHSNSNLAPLADEPNQTQPGVAATPPPEKPEPFKDSAPVVSPETVTKSAATPTANAIDRVGEFKVEGKREQRETADAAPPPAPQPTDLSVTAAPGAERQNEPKKAREAGRDDADEISVDGRTAGGVFNQSKPKEDRPNPGAASTTTARAAQNEARRKAAPAAKSGPPSNNRVMEEDRQERSAETRSVGGRRFRRQGNAWIDTAYNSSHLTSVARGSEQYRALVADESALRKIAEQLGGEVIVVWKGRAYRFY